MELVWKDPVFVEQVIRANYEPFPWVRDTKTGLLRMKMDLPDNEDLVIEYKCGEYLLLMAHGIDRKSYVREAIKKMRQALNAVLDSKPTCSFRYSPSRDDLTASNDTMARPKDVLIYGWGKIKSIIDVMEADRKDNMVMRTI